MKIQKFLKIFRKISNFQKKNFFLQIYYIGLRGDFTKVSREAVVITNYEIAANPADHKTKLYEGAGHQIQ